MCKELAKELRSKLKELGYNRTMVSVTSDYNSMQINVKSIEVDFKKVAELANNYKKIRTDHSGDILQGGNIFVSIDYAESLMESLENKYMNKAQEKFEAIQNSNELENILIKDNIYAFLGDFQMIWFRVPQADGTLKRYKCYNDVTEIAEIFARLFLNENIDILETSEPVQEVSNDIELNKCNFGYCKAYEKGDNCKKCSETKISQGFTGCVYASTNNTIEIVQEVSILEQIKQESENIISSINTESLETQKTSFEAVDTQLDKIYQSIEENRNNEEIRLQLRDIENDLKWHYSSLHELIEEQTMPDCADFNDIQNLKDIYITNWNELPQEIQKYILSCDKYWIDLQWINLYKDNKIVASIGISGHHKHDIEINSIGAGELFQWNLYKGYSINNLEVPADKQNNKIKVTHNEYENIAKELASRIYAKDDTKITYKEYEKMLDNYEILPFQINTDNEELKKIINIYADNETIEADRTIYRGSIDKSILYDLYQNKSYKDLYYEYYQVIICKDELKTILTYCEGDFIAEVYNTIEDYNKGIERTKKFIEEM